MSGGPSATRDGGRDARLLAALAEPLAPERAPFYVKGASNGSPDGWYMTPAGQRRTVYLGRNVVWAEKRLLGLIQSPSNGHAAA